MIAKFIEPDLISTSVSRHASLKRVAEGQWRVLFREDQTIERTSHETSYRRNWAVVSGLATIEARPAQDDQTLVVLHLTKRGGDALAAVTNGLVWDLVEARVDLNETQNFYRRWISKLPYLRGDDCEDQRLVLFRYLNNLKGDLAHLRQDAAMAILAQD